MSPNDKRMLDVNIPECETCTHFGWHKEGKQWRMVCFKGRLDYCVTKRRKDGTCGPNAKMYVPKQMELKL